MAAATGWGTLATAAPQYWCNRGRSARGLAELATLRRHALPRAALRRLAVRAAAESEAPPKPSSHFSRKDLLRIKREGPTIDDLVHKHVRTTTDTKTGVETETTYLHVPPEVLGQQPYSAEPNWYKLDQISIIELMRGLRERNWTNPLFKPDAEPWHIEFFQDSGRFLAPSFSGYRAVVTKADGTRVWCDLPDPGPQTFTEDYIAGGNSRAAIHATKREPLEPRKPMDCGYNQVFLEIFQAYEQRLPKQGREEFSRKGWVDTTKYEYDCPADQLLQISYHQTPQEISMAAVWERVPGLAFYTFAFSFLGICLAVGIFRPRRMMPGDQVQAMEFAQSKGQARKEGLTNVRFADVAGLDETLTELREVVAFLKDPKRYAALNAKPPKGVLLEGGPGTGKTLIAKAIAGESGVPFFQMSGSEFVEIIVGVGAARVRDLFKRARVNAPCIIFVDEIDALGIKRAEAGMKTNEEREQTLNQLLTEMDGFTPDIGVVFVAATNRADLLDPALMRAGRFDRKVKVLKPDTVGRGDVLRVHARKHPMAPDVDLDQVARDLPGLSPAELANVLNEAALETLRRDADAINTDDIYNAVDRVLQGVRRPALKDGLIEKRVIAAHEVGKGLVATVLRQRDNKIEPVERISMVPRGTDFSRTIFLRGGDEDYTMTTKARLLERIRVLAAGRAAEDVVFGPGYATTYAMGDIQDLWKLAEKVVTSYGMSDLGITTWAPPGRNVGFMQRNFEVHVDNIDADLFGNSIPGGMFQCSNSALYGIQAATMNLVNSAYRDCMEVLEAHAEALNAATDELLKGEQLTGQELEKIMKAHPPRPMQDTRDALKAKGLEAGEPLDTGASVTRAEVLQW
mmetsp:Transcript_16982/g.42620  ORF Transcript_16982/g.42620 Transcript_16982/m.42620 type:complete len:855 (+) Transcript_16982:187-2751(+)